VLRRMLRMWNELTVEKTVSRGTIFSVFLINIILVVKSRRRKIVGHILSVREGLYRVLVGKSEGK
jgi:hypothetical protein